MKASVWCGLILSACLLAVAPSAIRASGETKDRAFSSREWIDSHFASGKFPPFSFRYGGRESNSFIGGWTFRKETLQPSEAGVSHFRYTWTDRRSGLSVLCEVIGYEDYPAVEWVLHFRNQAKGDSPLIEHVRALDLLAGIDGDGPVLLHHSLGSAAARSDFEYLTEPLGPGHPVYLTPAGGRSSDNTALPFFNVEWPGRGGFITAVGWTGKWYAEVALRDKNRVNVTSGMERMKLYLLPGEEIRTPRIALLFWTGGDKMTGHNLFRQFILDHHTRKIDGKPGELPFASGLGYGGPWPCNEYSCATENYAIAMAYRYKQFGLVPEVLWIDAGWYTGCGTWWNHVGNWTANEIAYPNGLKPVTDAVHQVGAKFILWFEPERVYRDTWWDRDYPRWLIRIPDTVTREPYNRIDHNNALFNLGNPEARAWITRYIGDFIQKEGIDYYRQDFNFDPWYYWMYNDPPGREGISEIRHIEGLYAYWDALLERFPHLIIDNCASGGRRIDLETVSRSSPLWRTDYAYGEPNGYQCHTYGLNYYLPLHGTGNFTLNDYTFRSSLSSAMVTSWDINGGGYRLPDLQKYLADFKRLRPYYYGDYYPLTGGDRITTDSVWLAYQMNRPKTGDGIIVAFRRPSCPDERIAVKLRGLDPAARYELFLEDQNARVIQTGRELMDHLDLVLAEKPKSLLISYKLIN